PVFRPDSHRTSRSDTEGLQILGVQSQGVHDGVILVAVLANVNMLALLTGTARVHDKAHTTNRRHGNGASLTATIRRCRDGTATRIKEIVPRPHCSSQGSRHKQVALTRPRMTNVGGTA